MKVKFLLQVGLSRMFGAVKAEASSHSVSGIWVENKSMSCVQTCRSVRMQSVATGQAPAHKEILIFTFVRQKFLAWSSLEFVLVITGMVSLIGILNPVAR